jgi:hypothetical protein
MVDIVTLPTAGLRTDSYAMVETKDDVDHIVMTVAPTPTRN